MVPKRTCPRGLWNERGKAQTELENGTENGVTDDHRPQVPPCTGSPSISSPRMNSCPSCWAGSPAIAEVSSGLCCAGGTAGRSAFPVCGALGAQPRPCGGGRVAPPSCVPPVPAGRQPRSSPHSPAPTSGREAVFESSHLFPGWNSPYSCLCHPRPGNLRPGALVTAS